MFSSFLLSVLLLVSKATPAPSALSPSNQNQLPARPHTTSYELTFAGTCCPVYWGVVPLVKLLPSPIVTRTTEESLIVSIVGNATRARERKRVEFVQMDERDEGLTWEGEEPCAQIEVIRLHFFIFVIVR